MFIDIESIDIFSPKRTRERERETRGQSKLDRHIKSLLGENSFGNGRYRRMPGEILFVTLRVHFL